MKILIIGLGSMGKRRARLIEGLGGNELFGVDSAPTRRGEAEALGIKAFATLPEALEHGTFHAAFVCTAPLTHALIIDSLLEAGLPVFTELNLVSDGYEGLMEKAAAKNLPLFLSSTMLYRAETEAIQRRVQAFGKPVNYIYHIGQYLPDWHPWESYKDYFVGDARCGGVREILGIDLPWLAECFGPARPVCVEKDKLTALEIEYPDSWFITLRHESGAKGFLAVDVVTPKAVRSFEAFGEGLHLFWEGSPTTLAEYDPGTKEKRPINTYESFEHDPRYSDNIVENAYLEEILEFFEVLSGRAKPRWSFEKDLQVIDLIEAIEHYGEKEGDAGE